MGTLYSQSERDYKEIDIHSKNEFFREVLELSKEHKIGADNIIEGLKVLELRRQNDLYVSNGDIHDEQMAGLGEEFQNISSAINNIAENIKN